MYRYSESIDKLVEQGCADEDILELMNLFEQYSDEIEDSYNELAITRPKKKKKKKDKDKDKEKLITEENADEKDPEDQSEKV